jgi:acetyltransferase-like isoleucine patch superfamily enzyme
VKAIVSPHIRVRNPETLVVGEDSVIDDFCYFSARVRVGRCSHIASGCAVAGGQAFQFELGDFSSLSSGVKVWVTSDNFAEDLVMIIPPDIDRPIKRTMLKGDVILGPYTAVGSNSVIMPDNLIPEGTVVGALSFVPPRFPFEAWSVYAGTPIRLLRKRNREQVLEEVRELEEALRARGG